MQRALPGWLRWLLSPRYRRLLNAREERFNAICRRYRKDSRRFWALVRQTEAALAACRRPTAYVYDRGEFRVLDPRGWDGTAEGVYGLHCGGTAR